MAAFGSAIGGGLAIQEALARRGMSGGVTTQVSPSAPQFNPATQPSTLPTPTASPNTPQVPTMPNSGESKIIIQALKNRLDLLGKMGQ